jgi:hypothetical protein
MMMIMNASNNRSNKQDALLHTYKKKKLFRVHIFGTRACHDTQVILPAGLTEYILKRNSVQKNRC